MIRSKACTTDMIKAAATPFPDTSAKAMPIPRSRRSRGHAAPRNRSSRRRCGGRERWSRRSTPFAARRSIGQQAPLDVRCQGNVAAECFLFDDAIRQPRIFEHQRELIGAGAQRLFLARAEAGAVGPITQQQHAEDLSACAQWHGQADAGRGERANLVDPPRTVCRRPFADGGQFIRRNGSGSG